MRSEGDKRSKKALGELSLCVNVCDTFATILLSLLPPPFLLPPSSPSLHPLSHPKDHLTKQTLPLDEP